MVAKRKCFCKLLFRQAKKASNVTDQFSCHCYTHFCKNKSRTLTMNSVMQITVSANKGMISQYTITLKMAARNFLPRCIDPIAIQQKSLGRASFLYIFIHEIRSSGVRASITTADIRKFYKMYQSIVRFRFFFRIAKRSIAFFNRIPIDSLKISASNPMHLGKGFLAAIFSVLAYIMLS